MLICQYLILIGIGFSWIFRTDYNGENSPELEFNKRQIYPFTRYVRIVNSERTREFSRAGCVIIFAFVLSYKR